MGGGQGRGKAKALQQLQLKPRWCLSTLGTARPARGSGGGGPSGVEENQRTGVSLSRCLLETREQRDSA